MENPFPPIPAARLGGFTDEARTGSEAAWETSAATVETQALRDLRKQVEDYFARPAGSRLRGRAVALVGSLGMGKTHLADAITAWVSERENPPPMWVIDEPVLDMGRAYRDRLMKLGDDRNRQAAFEDVVRNYYADVAAARLEQGDEPAQDVTRAEIASGLRNRELDPQKVVHAFDIDEELIHRDLQQHLSDITEHRRVATALALLLEKGFKRQVWSWLSGDEPADPLKDRGVKAAINGTDPVFDMLAVFGFLHGRTGEPYVLVLDSLEKVLDWPETERFTFIDAFERLVNVYTNMGGLLIFCVPPEPLGRFRPNLHERIMQIWPTGLDRAQTAELIRAQLAPAPGGAPAAADGGSAVPFFDPEAVEEIADLSHGIPRQILKICWSAWDIARTSGGPDTAITPLIVHQAVRRLYETAASTYVRDRIEHTLAARQWPTDNSARDVPARRGGPTEDVGFWVRVGPASTIAIVTVESILVNAEVERISRTVRAVREEYGPGRALVLVVVNGHVSRGMRERVARVSGTRPIVYAGGGFEERLAESLEILARRLEGDRRTSEAEGFQQQLNNLTDYQHTLLDQVQRMGSRMERLAVAGPRPAGTAPPGTDLPEPVQHHFTQALEAVDLLYDDAVELYGGLGIDGSGAVTGGGRPHRLRFGPDQLRAMGAGVLVRRLVEAFREGVDTWLRAVRSAGPGTPERGQLDGLFVLCRSFEITMEMLPATRPEHWPASAAKSRAPAAETARNVRRAEAMDALGRLADGVLRSVTDLVSGGEAAAP